MNQTDIVTTCVESRAVLGKSQIRVRQALEAICHGLPFDLPGIDSDNGSEFLNAHLVRYCKGLDVQFTRGRPYKKDDNAHIEQTTWTHVRKLVGYERYDAEGGRRGAQRGVCRAAPLPESRLADGEAGAQGACRRYDAPQTPLDRVRACPEADRAKVAALVALRDRRDPFVLATRIDRVLERVCTLAHHREVPGRGTRPVDGARPVDVQNASTGSSDARQTRGRPHRRPAASSMRSSVTGSITR